MNISKSEDGTMLATSITVERCKNENCRMLHLALRDRDGNIFAVAQVKNEFIDQFIGECVDEQERIEELPPPTVRVHRQ